MKRLLYFSFIFVFANGFSQGEQLYADGVATDQEGNQFEWINYGNQDWAIENAKVVTYRDGTEIPQVTDATEWASLTTGAWCYHNNDPTKPRLYNWYAVMGIHDTGNKEFAPEGWHVPTNAEWATLGNYLIASGYNYDQTTTENKIAKAMASTSGWISSNNTGAIGNEHSSNNSSGFNAFSEGFRNDNGSFGYEGAGAFFWSSTSNEGFSNHAFNRYLIYRKIALTSSMDNEGTFGDKPFGFSVRFVRDAQTASVGDNSIYNFKIFPNPTKEYLNIYSLSLESVVVYNILGKELIKDTTNRINVSHLPKGVYFIKASDGMNSSTKKFIKN